VWAGTTKYLTSQCGKGRCVDLPLLGRFLRKVNNDQHIIFVPHLEFLTAADFRLIENEFNFNPLSTKLPVKNDPPN